MRISSLFLVLILLSCNERKKSGNINIGPKPQALIQFKALQFVDSFYAANSSEIVKNSALREQYENKCTEIVQPMITGGLYDDLPFEFVTSTVNNGQAYGNFIYQDEKHFAKVTCQIRQDHLSELIEGKRYFIKFEPVEFKESVSFLPNGDIDFPTVNARLISFRSL